MEDKRSDTCSSANPADGSRLSARVESWRRNHRRADVVEGEIPVTLANEAALRRALEAAGIDFIEDDGGGEGVRFRGPRKPRIQGT